MFTSVVGNYQRCNYSRLSRAILIWCPDTRFELAFGALPEHYRTPTSWVIFFTDWEQTLPWAVQGLRVAQTGWSNSHVWILVFHQEEPTSFHQGKKFLQKTCCFVQEDSAWSLVCRWDHGNSWKGETQAIIYCLIHRRVSRAEKSYTQNCTI